MTGGLACKLELAFHLRVDFGVRLKFGPGRAGIVRGYTGIVGGAERNEAFSNFSYYALV